MPHDLRTEGSTNDCFYCNTVVSYLSIYWTRQRYGDALATDGDTAVPLARVSPSLHPPHIRPSRPATLGVSAQTHGVGVPASDSQLHLHGQYSLDVAGVATPASVTVSNVVGMIGTKAGLGTQTAAMDVRRCVSPTNILPTGCQPFLLASISSARQMHRSSRRHTYAVSPRRAMPCLTLRRRRRVCIPFLQYSCCSKTTRGFN